MRVPIRLGGIGFVPAPGHGPLVQSLRLRMGAAPRYMEYRSLTNANPF